MQKTAHNNSLYITIIAATIFTCGLVYLLSPILMPFLLGAFLAYLCDPLVNKLMRYHLPRFAAVLIVFSGLVLTFILLILLFIPLIQKQITSLTTVLPNIYNWAQTNVVKLVNHFDLPIETGANPLTSFFAENIGKAGGIASWILATTVTSGKALLESILNIILIPVVTFYLLRDWDQLIRNIHRLIPRKIEPTVVKLVKECDRVLSEFFRGQLLVMLSLGIYYSIALTLMGLQIGVVIGLIIGLISIVPYLGLIVGVIIATIAALVQFNTLTSVIWVLAIFALGHSVENFYLTPKLIGDRVGLHPVAVIFAILAGGVLFGFLGVLLALPVASVIMVLIRHLQYRYRQSDLYKTT